MNNSEIVLMRGGGHHVIVLFTADGTVACSRNITGNKMETNGTLDFASAAFTSAKASHVDCNGKYAL